MALEDIVKRYEDNRSNYLSFSNTLSSLIERLLKLESIEIHSVSYRCKTLASLKGKVSKKRVYSSLDEVTDLAGIRLITHYEDDVDRIARLIENEFKVDAVNSIDKRVAMDPDRFGYLSLHYVVSLNAERSALKEYRSFAGLKAEIQVRSILQHSWAEIEHDTGYKSEVEIPRHIRRRFSRLAGLLEIADREFINIRDELKAYSVEVAQAMEKSIADLDFSDELLLPIDRVTLESFVSYDPVVARLDAAMADALGTKIEGWRVFDSVDISRLSHFNMATLGDLKKTLSSYESLVLKRISQVAEDFVVPAQFPVEHGISLYMFIHVLIAKRVPAEHRENYLKEQNFATTEAFLKQLEILAAE
ncbi:hypothetical protein VUG52_16590 [Pseudomonas sp. LH21]|uniref:GTP pyrophosphokinase n=1 Tax=Pseudomonas sp. LH21 TaxID=3114884 RepID=UPI002F951A8A